MTQTLDSFIVEAKKNVDSFEKWWIEQNKRNPIDFPMELPDGNEGLWWEFLANHRVEQ
jgi:hypothetical protein